MMAIGAHLAELAEKHRALEERIDEAVASPGCDDVEISRMKREKLKLKDEIERLKQATRH
ncbi:MAG: YdcH family protein [Hyphomicrobium sp.]